jgi:hypothetical protein
MMMLPMAGLWGCAQELVPGGISSAATACTSGTAQIAISDGYQMVLCGCQETAGQVLAQGTGSLTCTVPNGTYLFIHYQATRLAHQIIPTGSLVFPASTESDPSSLSQVRVHAFQLNGAGTYTYSDAFNPGLTGQFVVTP